MGLSFPLRNFSFSIFSENFSVFVKGFNWLLMYFACKIRCMVYECCNNLCFNVLVCDFVDCMKLFFTL